MKKKRKSITAGETGMPEKQTKLRSRREICVKGFQGRSPDKTARFVAIRALLARMVINN